MVLTLVCDGRAVVSPMGTVRGFPSFASDTSGKSEGYPRILLCKKGKCPSTLFSRAGVPPTERLRPIANVPRTALREHPPNQARTRSCDGEHSATWTSERTRTLLRQHRQLPGRYNCVKFPSPQYSSRRSGSQRLTRVLGPKKLDIHFDGLYLENGLQQSRNGFSKTRICRSEEVSGERREPTST